MQAVRNSSLYNPSMLNRYLKHGSHPGNWQDIWTGTIMHGPVMVVLNPELWKCPIYVRNSGIVFSLPQMQYTNEHAWNKIIVDAFVPTENNVSTTRTLYEDDGLSPDYQKNAFCKTPVTLTKNGDEIQFVIEQKQGSYNDAIPSRDWIIRLNLPQNSNPVNIMVNKKGVELNSSDAAVLIVQTEMQEKTMPFEGSGSRPRPMAGPILEVSIHNQDVLIPIRISCKLK